MTTDLVTWLREQIDADEREILRHGPPMPPGWGVTSSRLTTIQAGSTVLMNPTRVLAEVDAKRRILDEYRESLEAGESVLWTGGEYARITTLGRVIALLALPYADRPGYREEWRP